MDAIVYLIPVGLIVLLLTGTSWLVAICLYQLMPRRWRKHMHNILGLMSMVGSVLGALKLGAIVMVLPAYLPFTFISAGPAGPCFDHNYLHPRDSGERNAECWKALDQKDARIEQVLEFWVMIPPWQRPSCEEANPDFCKVLKADNKRLDDWSQYSILILIMVKSGFACTVTVHQVYRHRFSKAHLQVV